MQDHFDDIPNPTREFIAQSLTADAIREANRIAGLLAYSYGRIERLTQIRTEDATLSQYEAIEGEISHIKNVLSNARQYSNNALLLAILEKAAEWKRAALQRWAAGSPAEGLQTVRKARPVDTPAMAATRAAIREFLDKDRPAFTRLETGPSGDVFEALTMYAHRAGLCYEYRELSDLPGELLGSVSIEYGYGDFDKVLARLKHPGALAAGIPADWRNI